MRAIKLITAVSLYLVFLPAMAGTLTCTSSNKAFLSCGLDNAARRDISIKTIKSGSCVLGTTWGVDTSAIWVDKGCSAVFQYSGVDDYAYSGRNTTIVVTSGLRYIPWTYDYNTNHYYYSYQYHHYGHGHAHAKYHHNNYHKHHNDHHNGHHHHNDRMYTQGSSTTKSSASATKSTTKSSTSATKNKSSTTVNKSSTTVNKSGTEKNTKQRNVN